MDADYEAKMEIMKANSEALAIARHRTAMELVQEDPDRYIEFPTLHRLYHVGCSIHYVYAIYDHTFVKIGVTNSPENRHQALQSSTGHKLTIHNWWAYVNTNLTYNVERRAHEYFWRYRVRGEWFNILPEEVDWYMEMHHHYASSLNGRR